MRASGHLEETVLGNRFAILHTPRVIDLVGEMKIASENTDAYTQQVTYANMFASMRARPSGIYMPHLFEASTNLEIHCSNAKDEAEETELNIADPQRYLNPGST